MQSEKIETPGKYLKNVRLNDLKKLHPKFTKEQEAEHLAGFAKKFMGNNEDYLLLENDNLPRLVLMRPVGFMALTMETFHENPGLQYCGDAAFEELFMTWLSKIKPNFIEVEPTVEVFARKDLVEEEMKKDHVVVEVKKKNKKK